MRTTRYVSKIRDVVKREQPGRRPIAPRSLRLVALTPLSGASRLPPPRPAIAGQVGRVVRAVTASGAEGPIVEPPGLGRNFRSPSEV